MKKHYDVVIIGTGVAGLNTALNLPKELNVLLVSKDYAWECNTFYAQGGVTVAKDEADEALHIEDTLKAGAGHCDNEAVRVLCEGGREAIDSLIKLGFCFDKDKDGNLLFTK